MALVTPTTYKQLIEAFEQICLSQMSVKHFQVGEMSDVDMQTNTETFQRYPFVFMIPRLSSMDRFGKMVLGFSLIVADIAKNEEDLQVNVHNTTLMIMQDIFSKIIMTPASQVDWDVETPINITPFVEKYNNNLAGWTAEINVLMISPFNLCDAAFN
jgi:predicted amino acid-binding ACT domain protein